MSRNELNISSDKNSYEQIKNDLEKLYKSYYCSNNGACKYYDDCLKAAQENNYEPKYNFNHAVRLGENYPLIVNDKEVRIVVIGKESLEENTSVESPGRLAVNFDKIGGVNPHYRETYRILCKLMNYNWDFEKNENIEKGNYRRRPDAALTAFALTNMYRCAFGEYNKKGFKIHRTDEQHKRCGEILRKEIEILKPTILLIQNADLKAKYIFPETNIRKISEKNNDKGRLIYNFSSCKDKDNNECYIIQTVHPTCYGRWYDFVNNYLTDVVNYLREKGALPDLSTECMTAKLNELAVLKNS